MPSFGTTAGSPGTRQRRDPDRPSEHAGFPASALRSNPSPRDDLAVTFLAAAMDLDIPVLSEVLDAAWECYGSDDVADEWLLPTLELLGQDGPGGELRVVGEHLARGLARGRLMSDYDDAVRGAPTDPPRVLVGAAAHVRRDLGALAFAGILARAGVPATFLGGDVPDEAWEAAVCASATGHVVLVVPSPKDTAPTARLAKRLIAATPTVTVHVGGPEQHRLAAPLRRLGHHLGTAADTLALALAFDRLPDRHRPDAPGPAPAAACAAASGVGPTCGAVQDRPPI